MGVVNVTPDSFYAPSRALNAPSAVSLAQKLWDEGADMIDVGAESTRPGAVRVGVAEEKERLGAVLPELLGRGMTISVDTVNASTARWAVGLGAHIINDVSGGMHDPEMNHAIAESDARYVIQHWRGFPSENPNDKYDSVSQILAETLHQVNVAIVAGVTPEQVIIDPGLGFGMTNSDCWNLLDNLGTWTDTGYPVLVGASRKRFVRERFSNALEGTLAVTRRASAAGVWAVRVHDVAENLEVA